MSHLTDEQLEEIMQDKDSASEHLEYCGECRERLSEKEALANRLRSAFVTIRAEEGLAGRISRCLDIGSIRSRRGGTRDLSDVRRHWRGWFAIVSAAAALIVVASLVIYLATPSPAAAAQAELVEIHKHNLSAGHEFYSEADPAKLAEYFKNKLGFSPSMPHPGQGLALRGCCVRHFRGEIVGSYVVETPEGVMSIVVVTDRPQSLGMGHKFQHGEHTFWKSSFARCEMVTVRLGDYSYCAVGEVSYKYLTELLGRLVSETQR